MLELSYCHSIPAKSILIVDDEMARFTAYLPFTHSPDAPSYDVSGKEGGVLFTVFKETFNRVWIKSTPVIQEVFSLRLTLRQPDVLIVNNDTVTGQ